MEVIGNLANSEWEFGFLRVFYAYIPFPCLAFFPH